MDCIGYSGFTDTFTMLERNALLGPLAVFADKLGHKHKTS